MSNLKATGVTSDSLNVLDEAIATVHIDNSSLSQRLFVAQNISQEVILGTDFLAKLGEVAYNFQDCTFSFRNSRVPMGMPLYHGLVIVGNTIKVPASSEIVVITQITTSSLHGRSCFFESFLKSRYLLERR